MQLQFIAGPSPCTFEGTTFETLVATPNSNITSVLPAVAATMTALFPQGEGLSFSPEDIQNFLTAAESMPAELVNADQVNGKQFSDLILIAAEREVNPQFAAFTDVVTADNYVSLMEQTLVYLAEPEAETVTTTTETTTTETQELEFTTTEIVSEQGTTTEMVSMDSTLVEQQARLLATMQSVVKAGLEVADGIAQTDEALLNALIANRKAAGSSRQLLQSMGSLLDAGANFLPTNVRQAAQAMIEAGESAA